MQSLTSPYLPLPAFADFTVGEMIIKVSKTMMCNKAWLSVYVTLRQLTGRSEDRISR